MHIFCFNYLGEGHREREGRVLDELRPELKKEKENEKEPRSVFLIKFAYKLQAPPPSWSWKLISIIWWKFMEFS